LEGPEIHTPHRHAGGLPRWLELLIAVTALITSISSIAIALHHGEIMEKLVEANSIPYLEADASNGTPDGQDVISLDFHNRGVGPANQQSLKVKVGDRYVRSVPELIDTVLGPADAQAAKGLMRVVKNSVPTRFISGTHDQFVFRIPKTEANAAYWEKLSQAAPNVGIEYCYCSVFHDCWEVRDLAQHEVKQCRRDEAHEFAP